MNVPYLGLKVYIRNTGAIIFLDMRSFPVL